ncbi:MAG: extracellular solute-binding protein [Christensenellales bacterium]
MKKKILLRYMVALVLLCSLLPLYVIAEEPATLTYWCLFENNASKTVTNYADLPLYKEIMDRLNVNITFTHPPTGMDREQFSLLVASTVLPDIIEYNWYASYPDGPQAALDEKVIISLNEYLENGSLPNLKALFDSDPALAASCRTYEGEYYCFPFVRSNELMVQKGGGLTVRMDILDQLGLPLPKTISDWDKVFEEAQKAGWKHPFTGSYDSLHGTVNGGDESVFCGAWGVGYTFYHIDGKVKFGPLEEGYRAYLEKMAEWYTKGYIDPDFLTMDNSSLDGKMTGETSIATFRSPDSGIGVWTKNLKAIKPEARFVAAPFPTLVEGETRYLSNMNLRFQANYSAAISTSCENVEAALRLLDYAYSPEGNLLYNFGVEGISFEYDDQGVAQYTELITNNPNGLTLKEAMILWCRNTAGGPFVKEAGPILAQRRNNQDQYDAPFIWDKSVDWSRNLPRMVYSGDEIEEYNDIMSEIYTILEEMTVKIIIGDKTIEAYDDYIKDMYNAGIENAITIVQTALDRQTQ